MARLPRPIRHFLRRFKSAPTSPGAVNPQTVGIYPRASMRLYMPIPMLIALIFFVAAAGAAQVIQALHAGDARQQIAIPGTIGSLHIVFLPGNQVFIGNLESVDHGAVVLSDVFYLQSQSAQSASPLASGAQNTPTRGAQLIRRMDNDWHQPTHMSIPIEKIVMMENVGRDSIVARLITDGRARAQGSQQSPPPPPPPPSR